MSHRAWHTTGNVLVNRACPFSTQIALQSVWNLQPLQHRIEAWTEYLRGLLAPLLRAVPKNRTTHRGKRKRATGKGLTDRTDVVPCRSCGKLKLRSHLCLHCLRDVQHGS